MKKNFSIFVEKLQVLQSDFNRITPPTKEEYTNFYEIKQINKFELERLITRLRMLLESFNLSQYLENIDNIIKRAPENDLLYEVEHPPHITGYYGTNEFNFLLDDLIYILSGRTGIDDEQTGVYTGV